MRGSPGGGRAATAPPYGAGGRSADDPTEGTIITVITTVRPRARVAALLSATAILAVVLAGPGASSAQAATSPAPFDQATIDHVYASDATYDFVPMLDAFPTLKSGRPDIMQLNDDMTVQINQTAPKAQSDRAIIDQYADMSVSMSDGLGARLGAIYKAARDAGQLPKTAALLNKENGLVGRGGSTGPAKNHYANPRPYVRFPERLQYRDKPGGNAWAGQDGSYPSGHTSQAFWQGVSLATMLPELAPQILARASDAGNNRIVMGAHYPIDVMAGHMMGQKIVQRRWADPEFRDLYAQAATELRQVLEAGCGATLAVCIAADTPYLPTDQALAVYRQRLTYGFPLVGAAGQPMTVPDGAESLLRTSHPDLTDAQRRQVLALTAIDSGEPLDLGAAGSWERIDLGRRDDREGGGGRRRHGVPRGRHDRGSVARPGLFVRSRGPRRDDGRIRGCRGAPRDPRHRARRDARPHRIGPRPRRRHRGPRTAGRRRGTGARASAPGRAGRTALSRAHVGGSAGEAAGRPAATHEADRHDRPADEREARGDHGVLPERVDADPGDARGPGGLRG